MRRGKNGHPHPSPGDLACQGIEFGNIFHVLAEQLDAHASFSDSAGKISMTSPRTPERAAAQFQIIARVLHFRQACRMARWSMVAPAQMQNHAVVGIHVARP